MADMNLPGFGESKKIRRGVRKTGIGIGRGYLKDDSKIFLKFTVSTFF